MRNFKFRAWDKVTKQMGEVEELSSTGCDMAVRTLPDGDWEVVRRSFQNGEAELMQFTGLKDKNGREIYEGDILEVESDGAVGIVKWVSRYDGGFDTGWKLSFPATDISPEIRVNITAEEEIIGDIYQNPELIK